MPRVATVPGICCSDIKALSIASASTDSRATQMSPGRIVTRQEGAVAATDSTAAAVDIDVGTPWSEIKRLAGCANQKGLDQTLRSSSRALTSTSAGDAILLARSDAWRRNPLFTMAASWELSSREPSVSRSDRSSLATTLQQRACEADTLTFMMAPCRRSAHRTRRTHARCKASRPAHVMLAAYRSPRAIAEQATKTHQSECCAHH